MLFSRRFWVSAFLGFLLAVGISINLSGVAQDQNADILNQRGFDLLNEGAAADAFSTWREAENMYRAEGNTEGAIGTKLNQSLAQQALGLQIAACSTVLEALSISEPICQSQIGEGQVIEALSGVENISVNTIGLRLLGESLGKLGKLNGARTILEIAQQRATNLPSQTEDIQLALGNVHGLLARQSMQTYGRIFSLDLQSKVEKLKDIKEHTSRATYLYKDLGNSTNNEVTAKASLNIIDMLKKLLEDQPELTGQAIEAMQSGVISPLDIEAQKSFQVLESFDFNQFSTIDGIYNQLNLASNLLALKQESHIQSFWGSIPDLLIDELIEEATERATKAKDNRTLSLAYGTAGDFLEWQGVSNTLIIERYSQALSLAQSVQANDVAYEWGYKLAQLNKREGNEEHAEQYYQGALSALSSVRNDLLAVNSELRFSFKEEIEPVYRGYIQHLIDKTSPDFEQIIRVHDSLQLAQIENFLRCGRLVATSNTSDKTTIHMISLGETVEIIASKDNEFYTYSVPAGEVGLAAGALTVYTQSLAFINTSEEKFLPHAQLLYDKLIRPIEEIGWLSDGAELSFVLDAPFQSLPMGLLHDGQQYLIKKNPLSTSLQMISESTADGAGALFAGLSEAAPSFNLVDESSVRSIGRLPETQLEAEYVSDYVRSDVLLNQDFTAEKLTQELAQNNFKVVHISTHGQFSSIPEETFLLAWDESIDFVRLGQLFNRARGIDLLFLSACQTAAGDDRASLGLAGLAIQSSARNAIATLWSANSTGGSVLVSQFYIALAQGLNTAEALQQAQVILLESDNFSHPYYWASFVLAAS